MRKLFLTRKQKAGNSSCGKLYNNVGFGLVTALRTPGNNRHNHKQECIVPVLVIIEMKQCVGYFTGHCSAQLSHAAFTRCFHTL